MDRYDSYKDSGVERLGEIPSHWNTPYIKNLVETKITDGPHLTPKFIDEGGIPFLSVESIQNSKIDLSRRRGNISVEDHIDYSKKCKPQWNDILLVKSASVGKLTIVDIEDEFNIWSPLSLIRIKKNGNPKYFYYFFHTDYFQTLLKLNSGINTQPNIGMGVIENLKVVSPPLSEQEQIVSFLDTKTSLIDSLIEKTQWKIELLKEGRTSLINEVVTKGLNPNVEMKDSGVEWIGEIPKGWEVKRLKYVSDVKPSNVDKHIFPDEIQVRLCNYTDVYYNDFITESTELKSGSCSQMEFEKFRLEKGDVIITKDSESPDDIGIPCLVKDDFEDVVCGYHLALIRPQTMDGGFIFRFIQSDRTRRYFEIHSNGITRYGLGKSSIENLFLPLPPLSEQHQIVSYLDEHTQLIDKTISVKQRRIDTLKEYRQSLISEVVKGKMDVRVN